MLKNKILSSTFLGSFQKTTIKSIDFASKETQNNHEITMITLKGQTSAGFKIQRYTVFYFVIDFASVILSMCIGLLRQCTK